LNNGANGQVGINNFYVGKFGNNELRNGYIDEFAIWDSDQRNNLDLIYARGNVINLDSLVQKPKVWYRMGDGDTYPTIKDFYGNYDLTMTNSSAANIVNDVKI